jgi:ATP-dependent DNA ligase
MAITATGPIGRAVREPRNRAKRRWTDRDEHHSICSRTIRTAQPPSDFFAFDILMLKGKELRGRPLDWRRDLLKTKVMPKLVGINYLETFEVTGKEMLEAGRSQRLEGVIAKRRDSLYESGERSGAWVKMRVRRGQLYTEPQEL